MNKIGFVALGALAACVAACGLSAGDHATYRVGLTEADTSGDCNVDEDDSSTFRAGATFVLYRSSSAEDAVFLDTGSAVLTGTEGDDGYTFQGEVIDQESFGGQTIVDSDHDGLDDFGEDQMVDADEDGLEDSFDDDLVDTDGDGFDDRFDDDIVDADGDGEDDRIVTTGGDTLISTTTVTVTLTIEGDLAEGTAKSVTSSTCEGDCQGFGAQQCTRTQTFEGVEIDAAATDVSQ
ncbi:MAG: hypothetical protein HOW73_49305 [Polyangiaceae bacterium]|nr:hypothetical protein [Polyangiaceae bacterium]